MNIKRKENRIFFNIDKKAYANITLKDESLVCFELLKVEAAFRQKGLASILFQEVINYIKKSGYKKIELNPLPLDIKGLKIDELTSFYKKYGFRYSLNKSIEAPYLMEMIII